MPELWPLISKSAPGSVTPRPRGVAAPSMQPAATGVPSGTPHNAAACPVTVPTTSSQPKTSGHFPASRPSRENAPSSVRSVWTFSVCVSAALETSMEQHPVSW